MRLFPYQKTVEELIKDGYIVTVKDTFGISFREMFKVLDSSLKEVKTDSSGNII